MLKFGDEWQKDLTMPVFDILNTDQPRTNTADPCPAIFQIGGAESYPTPSPAPNTSNCGCR